MLSVAHIHSGYGKWLHSLYCRKQVCGVCHILVAVPLLQTLLQMQDTKRSSTISTTTATTHTQHTHTHAHTHTHTHKHTHTPVRYSKDLQLHLLKLPPNTTQSEGTACGERSEGGREGRGRGRSKGGERARGRWRENTF